MKRKHLLKKTLLASSVALLLAVCTDTEELTAVSEHSCTHGDLGPFQSVTAAALGGPSLVDVSVPHTAYIVTLPAITNGCGFGGSVIFTPEETTEYAFLLSRQRDLRVPLPDSRGRVHQPQVARDRGPRGRRGLPPGAQGPRDAQRDLQARH